MSFTLEFNPIYPKFESILLNIKTLFQDNGTTIHQARNVLKTIELENTSCVVKAFKVPNIINQFAYAYLRHSKAYKSYHNATKLQHLGINTPEAIGYVEFYRYTLLKESYFINRAFDYDFTMAHVRDDNPDDKKAILKAFARFTYDLHTKGVWHVDYSGGNILINRKDGSYEFSLVDINRMQFRNISGYEGLENFNKMWFDDDALSIIATEYAKLAKLETARAISEILHHDKKLKAHVTRRRRIKALFKGKK